jgi:tetratricopeptide (TPR) repeat protein
MEIPLSDARSRAFLLLVALAIAALMIYQAAIFGLADRRMSVEELPQMQRAVSLTPGNAEAWDRLARLQQWDFFNADLSRAISNYQRAVSIDPRSSHYWVDLAGGYEAQGDFGRANQAFQKAQSVYPLSAEVQFEYANFLLREQKYPEAYRELQLAVKADPSMLPLAISRTWRSSEDVYALVNQVLPSNTGAYLQALDFFGSIHNVDAGLVVWQHLISLNQHVPLMRLFPFFEEVIREDRSQDASRMWYQALAAAGLPHNPPANNSLIWNGDFSADMSNGGLGWRYTNIPGADATFDADRPPGGTRAFRIDFGGGNNPAVTQPQQYVAVEPGRSYHFHAYLKTSQISTESGMQFLIVDPNRAGVVNTSTQSFVGSHEWTSVEADIMVPSITHFLLVQVFRSPSRLFDNQLNGTVWIADVTLVPSGDVVPQVQHGSP